MELRHLRCFVALAETLHFGRAAEQLRMAQPALSQAIKALEMEVGTRLVFRTTRRVSLTAAGATFLGDARDVLERADRAVQRLRRASSDQMAWLRIGGVDSATGGFLPPVIRDFRQQCPDVDLRVAEMLTRDAVEAVQNHQLDIAFVRSAPDDALLVTRHVLSEPLVAVLPADHALARPISRPRQARVSPPEEGSGKKGSQGPQTENTGASGMSRDALAAEPLILPPRATRPIHHDVLRAWFQAGGLTPQIAQEANERHMIIAMVASGLGVSILPAWVAQFQHPEVVFRPIADPAVTLDVHMVKRKAEKSAQVAKFEAIMDGYL